MATPFPWRKNLTSHGTCPLRPPNGGFMNTHPLQNCANPSFSIVNMRRAGTQWSGPGEHGSRSNDRHNAVNISGGVYHSSDAPMLLSCSAMTMPGKTELLRGLRICLNVHSVNCFLCCMAFMLVGPLWPGDTSWAAPSPRRAALMMSTVMLRGSVKLRQLPQAARG